MITTAKLSRKASSQLKGVPFGRNALQCAPHERVLVEHCVKVFDREREQVAVGLGPHARHSPGVGEQTDLAKVRAVAERSGHVAVVHHDVNDALLDEVHLGADRSLFDDDITYLKQTWRV